MTFNTLNKKSLAWALLLTATLYIVRVMPAHAHLMMAQNGTLNIVDEGIYMVLSVPITAFPDIDQDYDDEVSLFEFNSRRNDITAQITRSIALNQAGVPVALKDLRLVPVRPHSKENVYLSQLIIMGRFDTPESTDALNLTVSLFGLSPDENTLKITAKRPQTAEESVVILTPSAPSSALFSSVIAQHQHASSLP